MILNIIQKEHNKKKESLAKELEQFNP
jgi:hypothetical protein